jgi:cytochrome P450
MTKAIPGPTGWAKWRAVVDISKRPHEYFLYLAKTYGDIAQLDFPGERVVILTKPEYIEHVLHQGHRNYEKQTGRWRSLRQIWGNGLITSDGEFWKKQRQRMQPAFHQECIDGYLRIFVEEAQRSIGEWGAAADAGQPRDIFIDMMACSLRSLTRAMFGSEVEDRTDEIIRALQDIHPYVNPASLVSLIDPPKAIRRVVTPGYRKFERGLATIHKLLDDMIAKRAAGGGDPHDLLSLIMHGRDEASEKMTVEELHDEMMVVLMAGHETTGIALAWAFHWLAKTPDVERRLHSEVDTVLADRMPTLADLPRLEYNRMVLDEVLRICPPIYAFDRRAIDDDEIDGYVIPKGSTVGLSPYALHHHPKYWDHPEAFDPDRFSAERSAGRPDYAFFPFGGGPRRCIGFRFATMESIVLLATLSRRFELRPVPGKPVEPIPRLNFMPRAGVVMSIRRRTADQTAAPATS